MLDLPSLTTDGRVSRVAQLLRDEIIRGAVAPGTQLRVEPLAEQLGTSKGTVREAIRELVSQGLLEHQLHRGTFVRQFTAQDCHELYVAREVIEVWAAQQLVTKSETPDYSRLRSAVDRMSETADEQEIVDADMDFHRGIVALAGVQRLTDMHESIIDEIVVMVRSFHPMTQDNSERVHADLLNKFESGDRNVGHDLAEHLRSASKKIVATLTEHNPT